MARLRENACGCYHLSACTQRLESWFGSCLLCLSVLYPTVGNLVDLTFPVFVDTKLPITTVIHRPHNNKKSALHPSLSAPSTSALLRLNSRFLYQIPRQCRTGRLGMRLVPKSRKTLKPNTLNLSKQFIMF